MLKRDFGILLLSVCALYVSLQKEGSYQFKKAWYHSFDEGEERVHELDEHPHPVPPPLVTDLNGDGKPEVITATPAGKLQILAPRRFGDGFAKAELLSQVELDASGKMRIAVLRSGYLRPLPKELVRAPRKQVVVVVTADLKLLCLNHNLQKVWEADLAPHFPVHGGIRELAVHISDQRITSPTAKAAAALHAHQAAGAAAGAVDGDGHGIVVVGASVVPLTAAQREELEDEVEQEAKEELLARFRARGRKGGAEQARDLGDVQADGRHFSYFAFEGETGALRWMHEAKDFHRDLGEMQDALVEQHAFHRAAEDTEAKHYGEASCRDYRASVLAALPHSWHSPVDTSLVPMHFTKHKEGAGSQKQHLSKLGALKAKPGGAAGAAGAHQHGGAVGGVQGKASARGGGGGPPAKGGAVGRVVGAVVKGATKGGRGDALPPNVVVAHLEEGIEAIHLFSGRTVCRLHLPSPGLHVDLNGDGVPEHVVAVGGSPEDVTEEAEDLPGHRHHTYCHMSVMSGVPARLNLFNGTICRRARRRWRRGDDGGADVMVAPPIYLPQPGKHGHYRSGVGQKGLAVFLNSQGEITAYNAEGELVWQHYVGATWSQDEDEDVPDPVPTLRAMPLRPRAVPTVILAAGESLATVVSEHGSEIDTWELPDKPVLPLQLADFNFDGYTDVLLVSQDGLWAWAQVRHPGALPFSALVAALMVIMAAMFVTQQQGFASSGPGAKRRPLRSTERED